MKCMNLWRFRLSSINNFCLSHIIWDQTCKTCLVAAGQRLRDIIGHLFRIQISTQDWQERFQHSKKQCPSSWILKPGNHITWIVKLEATSFNKHHCVLISSSNHLIWTIVSQLSWTNLILFEYLWFWQQKPKTWPYITKKQKKKTFNVSRLPPGSFNPPVFSFHPTFLSPRWCFPFRNVSLPIHGTPAKWSERTKQIPSTIQGRQSILPVMRRFFHVTVWLEQTKKNDRNM